jgi:hypothetical protein
MIIKKEFNAAYDAFIRHWPDLSPEGEATIFWALNDAIAAYEKEKLNHENKPVCS